MSIFDKKIKNSNKFRIPAITFQRSGVYCSAPIGTLEYNEYWDREIERCTNGYTAPDGDWISGYNYFYLNYCPIEQTIYKTFITPSGHEIEKPIRIVEFPSFYDYDYYFFLAVQQAEDEQKHMCVLKSRRKGYSYKCGSMMARNFYLFPNSKSYAYASDTQYLDKDGILTKCWSYMDHIDKHTAWGKKRDVIDRAFHKRASFLIKDALGNKIEQGYKSEIIGASIAKNPNKVRGKAGKLILFEEAGKCFDPDTKIVMLDGSVKAIKDVKIGDTLMGPDNTVRNVTNIQCGEDTMYKVTPNNGNAHFVNSKHIIYGKKKGYGIDSTEFTITAPEYIDLIDKKPYLKNYMSLEKSKCLDFNSNYKLPIDPYLLGLWLGDGDSDCLCFTTMDEEIKEYLTIVAKENGLFLTETNLNSIANRYMLSSGKSGVRNPLLLEFKRNHLINNKHIPDIYKNSSIEDRLLLLAGIIDTDGYYDHTKNYYEIVQKREDIIDDCAYIFRSLGIKVTKTIKIINNKKYYRLFVLNPNIKIPTRIKRKQNIVAETCDKYLLSSFNVEESHYGKYVGITVDGDNLFLLDDFTIVHNCPELEAAWHIARPSVETDGKAWGLMIAFGTGGSEDSDFGTLKKMFYNPESYNMIGFDNIWDEGHPDKKCGFFTPQYTNMIDRDPETGKRLYMDDDGNTIYNTSVEHIMELRKPILENANSTSQVDRYVAENCITPQEACLELSGNIFPKKDLQVHLGNIRTHTTLQSHKQVGDLVYDQNGNLEWHLKKNGDITTFHLSKEEDRTGSIVIWEHPVINAPFGLYVAGCDPYDHDSSTTDSLGSVFIFKRFQNFEEYYDLPVAEYTGRPNAGADEFYENVRKLLLYYNATMLYENQNKGLFAYFKNKHCEYLLADQPSIIKDIVQHTNVERIKGVHMAENIKDWGESLIRDWLIEEYAPGKKNLTKILSEPLLEELIAFNRKRGNYDRVMSFMMVMIYRVQLHELHVKQAEQIDRKKLFLDFPIFKGLE